MSVLPKWSISGEGSDDEVGSLPCAKTLGNLWMKSLLQRSEGEVTCWVPFCPFIVAQREQAGHSGGACGTLCSDSSSKKAPYFHYANAKHFNHMRKVLFWSLFSLTISLLKSHLCIKVSLEGFACEVFPLWHFSLLMFTLHVRHSVPKHDSLCCWADGDQTGSFHQF